MSSPDINIGYSNSVGWMRNGKNVSLEHVLRDFIETKYIITSPAKADVYFGTTEYSGYKSYNIHVNPGKWVTSSYDTSKPNQFLDIRQKFTIRIYDKMVGASEEHRTETIVQDFQQLYNMRDQVRSLFMNYYPHQIQSIYQIIETDGDGPYRPIKSQYEDLWIIEFNINVNKSVRKSACRNIQLIFYLIV